MHHSNESSLQLVLGDAVDTNDVAVSDDLEARQDPQVFFKEQDGDGFFCMDKVMTVQEIIYDEEVGNFLAMASNYFDATDWIVLKKSLKEVYIEPKVESEDKEGW